MRVREQESYSKASVLNVRVNMATEFNILVD